MYPLFGWSNFMPKQLEGSTSSWLTWWCLIGYFEIWQWIWIWTFVQQTGKQGGIVDISSEKYGKIGIQKVQFQDTLISRIFNFCSAQTLEYRFFKRERTKKCPKLRYEAGASTLSHMWGTHKVDGKWLRQHNLCPRHLMLSFNMGC